MTNCSIYNGRIYDTSTRYWLDGMVSEYIHVWNIETHKSEQIQVGYYGVDGYNLAGDCGDYEIGVTDEVKRDILRTLKNSAITAFCDSVINHKREIHAGDIAEVVRGRKVAKGTVITVFWVGERPTYHKSYYDGAINTELIAGGHDANGAKIWIKAEYLRNINPPKSPTASERKKYIKEYVKKGAKAFNLEV